MARRSSNRILAIITSLLVLGVICRIITGRLWEKRVAAICFSAPEISARLPLILSNADVKMKLLGNASLRHYPEPDAIVIREHSTILVWEPPLICWLPRSMRTGSEGYSLEFSFARDGTVTSRCHHGSD
jgi:hypothetical protein